MSRSLSNETALALALAAALFAAGLSGCGGEENETSAELRSALIIDRTVLGFIELFQLHLLKATLKDGGPLSCQSIPNPYQLTDAKLVFIPIEGKNEKNVPWDKTTPSEEIKLTTITVPVDEPLIFVARGMGSKAGMGVVPVAHGCTEKDQTDAPLVFKRGGTANVTVDVRATTGHPCISQLDCETHLACHTGQHFKGGYCAKVGCTSDDVCPPGARCVSDGASGLCLRACTTLGDCGRPPSPAPETDVQDCVGRQGPVAGGCAEVCVNPLWGASSKCTP